MATEIGVVRELFSDMAQVELERQGACSKCRVGCHLTQEGKMLIEAKNLAVAKKGDRVKVEIPTDFLLKIAFVGYGVPTLAFLGFFILFRYGLFFSEAWSFLAGLGGLIISFYLVRSYGSKHKKALTPLVVGIVSD